VSDTPRTDKETGKSMGSDSIVYASFARQLERELVEAREQRDRLAEAGKILAEEYEDRRSQWGGEYLWQKYEDAQRVDAAIAVFAAAVEGGSDE